MAAKESVLKFAREAKEALTELEKALEAVPEEVFTLAKGGTEKLEKASEPAIERGEEFI